MEVKKIDEHFNTHGFSYISRDYKIKHKLSLNLTDSLISHHATVSNSFIMVCNKTK